MIDTSFDIWPYMIRKTIGKHLSAACTKVELILGKYTHLALSEFITTSSLECKHNASYKTVNEMQRRKSRILSK